MTLDDTVILEAGLGGLCTATLLAPTGRDTPILEGDARLGGRGRAVDARASGRCVTRIGMTFGCARTAARNFATTSPALGTVADRVTLRSHRDPLRAWTASPCLARQARLCHDGRPSPSRQRRDTPENPAQNGNRVPWGSIRWSIQRIRRIAARLARHQSPPAFGIAWSNWRRAHPAEARRAQLFRSIEARCRFRCAPQSTIKNRTPVSVRDRCAASPKSETR